jgi:dihydroorotate dehydrogenase (fumarate)
MDLSTEYLGLKLRTPLVPSASPLSEHLDHLKEMEDAGAAAVVFHSLYEEQIVQEQHALHLHLEYGTESYPEALTYFPEPEHFHVGPEAYLDHIAKAKEALQIPVIASLNGSTRGGWVQYAKRIEQAGADALELNIYYLPTEMDLPGAAVEQNYLDILEAVRREVDLPIAVKLAPFFSNFANMARRLENAGASGLVLFNRFYQPDIELETLEVTPNLVLSRSVDMRLPLRWIAILYGRIGVNLAATGGVHHGLDALKLLMAGADVTMVCSALLRHGISYLRELEREMVAWLEEHEYDSVTQLKGSMSHLNCPDPGGFERAQYMRALTTYHP